MPHSLTPNKLIDSLIDIYNLKNDAALCRALEFRPPVISKIRNGVNQVSPEVILRMHEKLGISVKSIRALMPAPEPETEAQ